MAQPTKVVTGRIRLSYAHLLEPSSSFDGQEAKYSTVLLIPKSDTKTVKAIKAAQAAALEAGISSKFNGKKPANLKTALRDGDEEKDLETNPEYAGHWFMGVNSKRRPGIVDAAAKPLLDGTEVYSGQNARVSINAFAYNVNGNKGISFGLDNVQILGGGEPLGGMAAKAEDEFDAVEVDDEEDDLI